MRFFNKPLWRVSSAFILLACSHVFAHRHHKLDAAFDSEVYVEFYRAALAATGHDVENNFGALFEAVESLPSELWTAAMDDAHSHSHSEAG